MPSREIISSVKRNTPSHAALPVFSADVRRWPSISLLIFFAVRHMCTVRRGDRDGRGNREHAFPQRLVRRLLEQDTPRRC